MAESASRPQANTAKLLPDGTTVQVTNPLFSEERRVSQAAKQVPAQGSDPIMAELADGVKHGVSSQLSGANQPENPRLVDSVDGNSAQDQSIQQLQQQIQGLHSQLTTQGSELQISEAGKEYIQRLLNAVTAENKDLRGQLNRKQLLKRSASELKHTSSSSFAKGSMAEPMQQGLLGLQLATSRIPAVWLTSSSVRRSLLPEYGATGMPYTGDDPTLQGAQSLSAPPVQELQMPLEGEGDSGLSDSSYLSQEEIYSLTYPCKLLGVGPFFFLFPFCL